MVCKSVVMYHPCLDKLFYDLVSSPVIKSAPHMFDMSFHWLFDASVIIILCKDWLERHM